MIAGILFIALCLAALWTANADRIAEENHRKSVEAWKRYYAERRERNADKI